MRSLCALTLSHSPSVVVAWVYAHRVAERAHRLVQLLNEHVLVPEQGVGVRKVWVDLQGAKEEPYRRVVFLLQAEAVARRAPSLRNAVAITLSVQYNNP